MSTPLEITVRPNRWNSGPCFGVCTPGDTNEIKGEDIAKAANPLHQIPFISQVYEAATGDTGSSAAKLIGGALLGGPIGFLVSLADVVFTQETGKGVLGTAYAALMGEGEAATQVADAATGGEMKVASLAPGIEQPLEAAEATSTVVTPLSQEILPPEASLQNMKQDEMVARALRAKANLASGLANAKPITELGGDQQKDADILSLFGGQKPSAHKSYERAQMLPYLKDVSTSMVL